MQTSIYPNQLTWQQITTEIRFKFFWSLLTVC